MEQKTPQELAHPVMNAMAGFYLLDAAFGATVAEIAELSGQSERMVWRVLIANRKFVRAQNRAANGGPGWRLSCAPGAHLWKEWQEGSSLPNFVEEEIWEGGNP